MISVRKPSGPISLDLPTIRGRLLQALRAAASVDVKTIGRVLDRRRCMAVMVPPLSVTHDVKRHSSLKHDAMPVQRVVVIGASTGGPRALAEIIPALPDDLNAAVLVAQHMPREFTGSLADRLNKISQLSVSEAVDGEQVLAGRVYIAPGRTHMCVAPPSGSCGSNSGCSPPRASLHRPTSCSHPRHLYSGSNVVGVVLTGMGRDGAEGARTVREAGGEDVLIQDRDTSVIHGMPGAALAMVPGGRVIALHDMAAAIVQELPSITLPFMCLGGSPDKSESGMTIFCAARCVRGVCVYVSRKGRCVMTQVLKRALMQKCIADTDSSIIQLVQLKEEIKPGCSGALERRIR